MATKKTDVDKKQIVSRPVYRADSRMMNYELVYDDSVNQMRCGIYTNKLKNMNSAYDQLYEVEAGFEHRLDLISYKFYSTATLDWAIADANNISDPIKQVLVGTVLRIPARNIL